MPLITKIQVSNGIYWVEIPEAGLFILCGCPADSVKHLMKRGLIRTKEENGIVFETGPNAILLSDVLIQNGRFSNLSEFPVLQMFYRQGLIIPNHPNKTGQKPILLGSKKQVKAQLEYIYRGNYGLTSKAEMLAAGVSDDNAEELMRIKVKFAFGHIKRMDEFIKCVYIENESVEVNHQVYVRRLAINIFEFSYKNETVKVDLNLAESAQYQSSYPLNFHSVPRGYFSVVHSGEGNGWDVNRPAMSSVLIFQGKIYLIDAGPNIVHSLNALGIGANEVVGIFQTHAHDDHFCGLSSLMWADHRIKYYATPLVRASVAKKLSALVSQDEDEFSHYFDICDLIPEVWNNIESLEVRPVFSPHPVETTIMYFRAPYKDGYRTYGHLADLTSFRVLGQMVTTDQHSPGLSPQLFDLVKTNYLEMVDLKKIDIGGGMIHGEAEDFATDNSTKIILAHTEMPLTKREKEIGSGAPFGMVDDLISSHQDYVRYYAYHFLHSYFPHIPVHQLRILLNNPVVVLNPESILLKNGETVENIYLILTGEVEMIQSSSAVCRTLSAGALVGEISVMTGSRALETYRATNFVQALLMPRDLYLTFLKNNGLYEEMIQRHQIRAFLTKTWLCGEAIAYPIQNRIAQSLTVNHYATGGEIPGGHTMGLSLIHTGHAEMKIENDLIEILSPGDFFGEGPVLFHMPDLFKAWAISDVEIFHIPATVLEDIPIVRWKLLEIYEKRLERMLNPDIISVPIFQWRDEYRTNVLDMDRQHMELFHTAHKMHESIMAGKKKRVLEESLNFLIKYTGSHFNHEELLMKEHHFPDYETHRKKHERLIHDIMVIHNRLRQNEIKHERDIISFIKDLIINHILTEDRKYGPYLNSKGIF